MIFILNILVIICYLTIVIMALFIMELIWCTFVRRKLSKGFVVTEKGLFLKNYIFMSIDKKAKKHLKSCTGIDRGKVFLSFLESAFDNLHKEVVYKTLTHGTIIKRIKKMQTKGKLQIIQCKKTLFPRPMLLNKIAIKNYSGLIEFKRFYKIKFKKL